MSSPNPPERSPEQVDAEFAKIVAGFGSTYDGDVDSPEPEPGPRAPIWPANGPVLNRPGGATGDPRAVDPDDPSLLEALDTFGSGLPDDAPEEFVPPPPPPLPYVSPAAIVSFLAIVGGLVLFIDGEILPIDAGFTFLISLICIIGGAVGLIVRLRPDREDDDDTSPPDGAVV